ncbi:MAG: PIG-L family deacetylase [Actinobacteria bacterium]|nr:PIG-L family deacetylase [Actinomycetota bacterium]
MGGPWRWCLAHPDDACVRRGGHGGAIRRRPRLPPSSSTPPTALPRRSARLPATRERRRRSAAGRTGRHGSRSVRVPGSRHRWLGLDDGQVSEAPGLEDRIAQILAEERPDVVGTFGPDGMTGHPDHIAVGAATDAAFHRLRGGPGFRRLLHGAMPESVFQRWNASRVRRGERPWDPSAVYDLRGVPDEQIAMSVDVSRVADRIIAGLREHRSQAHVIGTAPDEVWATSVSMEHYVVAWPLGETGLTDVFEGL